MRKICKLRRVKRRGDIHHVDEMVRHAGAFLG